MSTKKAPVLESAMFFINKAKTTAVKMHTNGDITAIGKTARLVPFCPVKFGKVNKDQLKYAIARTNVQDLEMSGLASYMVVQLDVNKTRKATAAAAMTGEGFDEKEIETQYEKSIDRVSKATIELADAKAERSAIKAKYDGGAKKALELANKQAEKEAYEKAVAEIAAKFGKKSIGGIKAAEPAKPTETPATETAAAAA